MSPCNYADYHPDWKSIRRQVLDQAEHACEFCGVKNGETVIRERIIRWTYATDCAMTEKRPVKIVLTVAHLDHDVTNNEPSNIRALCQKCHLNWDSAYHQKNAAETRRKRRIASGQLAMEAV